MHYNPFDEDLSAIDGEIENLGNDRDELVEQIAWSKDFKPEEVAAEIASLRSDLNELNAELETLDEDISETEAKADQHAAQYRALKRDTSVGWRVYRWANAEYRDARALREAHLTALVRLRERKDAAENAREEVTSKVAELTDQVSDKEQDLGRFAAFCSGEVDTAINMIDEKVAVLERERDDLKARKASVDRAIEAPLAELERYRSEVEGYESTLSRLRSELSQLEDQVTEVKHIKEKLSQAKNSYERAKLHDKCEERFGDGSPGAAIRDIQSKIRPLKSRIRNYEGKIEGGRRNVEKIEKRIKHLAEVAAREIDALIVDGNNCCYQGDEFIGLAALIPMTESLAVRYPVTVVFDATIRRRLGFRDADLRAALPAAKEVHVVATHTKADETILDLAHEPTDWVVSNDRFRDFSDKACVEEGRVIRHEIVRGRIFVHDLGVDQPLADSGLT